MPRLSQSAIQFHDAWGMANLDLAGLFRLVRQEFVDSRARNERPDAAQIVQTRPGGIGGPPR
jgi:hypothetical protein